MIVGWALSDTFEAAPVVECMRGAIEEHGIPGIAIHKEIGKFCIDRSSIFAL